MPLPKHLTTPASKAGAIKAGISRVAIHFVAQDSRISFLKALARLALPPVPGIVWLTHEVDYGKFPTSLMVVWVFDPQANVDQALANGQGACMVELTASALRDADVLVSPVSAYVHFDDGRWHDRRDDWRRDNWRRDNWHREQARQEAVRRRNWERHHDRAMQHRYEDDHRYYRR
jgi:hypothetical protein